LTDYVAIFAGILCLVQSLVSIFQKLGACFSSVGVWGNTCAEGDFVFLR
jgi:hypothetical protein